MMFWLFLAFFGYSGPVDYQSADPKERDFFKQLKDKPITLDTKDQVLLEKAKAKSTAVDQKDVAFFEHIKGMPLDQETVAFFDKINKEKTTKAILNTFSQAKKRCAVGQVEEENAAPSRNGVHLYICLSFCIPPRVWQDLFKESSRYPFTFVVRGIPQNSFKALAPALEKIGCPVSIHPDLFEQYQIEKVPAFVFVQDTQHEVVFGNVSLDYVLTHLKEKGTGIAQRYAA